MHFPALALFFLVGPVGAEPARDEPARPNIILSMGDDAGGQTSIGRRVFA